MSQRVLMPCSNASTELLRLMVQASLKPPFASRDSKSVSSSFVISFILSGEKKEHYEAKEKGNNLFSGNLSLPPPPPPSPNPPKKKKKKKKVTENHIQKIKKKKKK